MSKNENILKYKKALETLQVNNINSQIYKCVKKIEHYLLYGTLCKFTVYIYIYTLVEHYIIHVKHCIRCTARLGVGPIIFSFFSMTCIDPKIKYVLFIFLTIQQCLHPK